MFLGATLASSLHRPPIMMRILTVCGIVALAGCAQGTAADAPTPAAAQAALTEATVSWPPVSSEDRALRQALSREDRAAIERTPIPVLWPAGTTGLRRTAFIGKDQFYSLAATAAAPLPGGGTATATITLQGTRRLMQYEHMPRGVANRAYRNRPAYFTVNEGIASATWLEFGVSYSLDVECDTPVDARCMGDGYVKELVESLRLVGGRR